ncbi:MAG: hypothetical protein HYR56_05665 [Acidobacteria bacterium]|nr:hypothetical protein [Acidobacteriota bacterium]MBI3421773.1 hypothetical protein [Acidobacteriota bacterium]
MKPLEVKSNVVTCARDEALARLSANRQLHCRFDLAMAAKRQRLTSIAFDAQGIGVLFALLIIAEKEREKAQEIFGCVSPMRQSCF